MEIKIKKLTDKKKVKKLIIKLVKKILSKNRKSKNIRKLIVTKKIK